MKIGIVCPYDIFRGGGVQEHVLAQAEELRKRGYVVKILTPRPLSVKTIAPKDVIFAGKSAKVKTPIKTTLELGASFGRDTIDEILINEDFDILHVHEPEVPFMGAQVISKARCPIVATFHAIHPDTPMSWTIEAFRIPYSRSIFSNLTEITAVSEVAADFVRERTGRRVSIIPNGINLDKYSKVKNLGSSSRKTKNILYVGRLEKRKGVKYLLRAFAKLSEKDDKVKLIIAGDGSDREKLEDWVKHNNIKRVEFLGFVTDKQKLALFTKADLFCSPALYGESFGIVLLEAMAMGVVTVAGNNDGYKGVMQDTGQLSIVDPTRISEFADRLGYLLNDEAVRRLWLDWSSEYVKQFDYKFVVDKYVELYDKIVSQK